MFCMGICKKVMLEQRQGTYGLPGLYRPKRGNGQVAFNNFLLITGWNLFSYDDIWTSAFAAITVGLTALQIADIYLSSKFTKMAKQVL